MSGTTIIARDPEANQITVDAKDRDMVLEQRMIFLFCKFFFLTAFY